MSRKHRCNRFDLRMTADQPKLKQFLNCLAGEITAIIPNVSVEPFILAAKVNFLLVVEKVV